jgi:hypothetical protein
MSERRCSECGSVLSRLGLYGLQKRREPGTTCCTTCGSELQYQPAHIRQTIHKGIQDGSISRANAASALNDPYYGVGRAEREVILRDIWGEQTIVSAEVDLARRSRLRNNIMTLYHQTDHDAWRQIAATGLMLRGSKGVAGGGIYFAESARETHAKAIARGVIVEALVLLGHVKHLSYSGDPSIRFRRLLREGYDSVTFPRHSGREWVVYSHDQVSVLRHWDV